MKSILKKIADQNRQMEAAEKLQLMQKLQILLQQATAGIF